MFDCVTTNRLTLRPLFAADGDVVVPILNRLEVSRWLVPIPHPFTHADLRILNEDGSNRWPDLAAIDLDGVLIGGIAMGARLGYYLAPEFWGRGFGKEAAQGAINYSFATLGVDAMHAGYFDGNEASRRILTVFGFVETGRGPALCAALNEERLSVSVTLTRAAWEARA